MNYRPKVVRCRLKTGGKSIPQIREECRGQGLTYRDFENIQRSNEEFDGLVVLLSLWAYDNHASYHEMIYPCRECENESLSESDGKGAIYGKI